MSYRTVFLTEAERDMGAVFDYLSRQNPGTAKSFFKQLKKQVLMLEEMPYMCQPYDLDPYFRWMVLGDFQLYYSVNEKRQLIVVHRIFHSSREISRQILSEQTAAQPE